MQKARKVSGENKIKLNKNKNKSIEQKAKAKRMAQVNKNSAKTAFSSCCCCCQYCCSGPVEMKLKLLKRSPETCGLQSVCVSMRAYISIYAV